MTASIEIIEKRVLKTDIAGIKKFWLENKDKDEKFNKEKK